MTSRDRLGDCEPSPFPSISGAAARWNRSNNRGISSSATQPESRTSTSASAPCRRT